MTQTECDYKVLMSYGTSPYTGFRWPLPSDGKPGEWVEVQGDLFVCENGIHFCRGEKQLLEWLGPRIYRFEADPEADIIISTDKCVIRRGRLLSCLDAWNDVTARLFAADCAEHVLWIWTKHYPDDDRPRRAISAARAFAAGEKEYEGRTYHFYTEESLHEFEEAPSEYVEVAKP